MVFTWKRVVLFLTRVLLLVMSFLLAVPLWSFLLWLWGDLHAFRTVGIPFSTLKNLLYGVLGMSFMTIWFGWGGLILAIPALGFFTNLRAWRFWALLALGAAIGPVYLCLRIASESHWHFDWTFLTAPLLLAAPISGLSALIYLALLRLLLRRSQRLKQA